jgi:hypothetical protein
MSVVLSAPLVSCSIACIAIMTLCSQVCVLVGDSTAAAGAPSWNLVQCKQICYLAYGKVQIVFNFCRVWRFVSSCYGIQLTGHVCIEQSQSWGPKNSSSWFSVCGARYVEYASANNATRVGGPTLDTCKHQACISAQSSLSPDQQHTARSS